MLYNIRVGYHMSSHIAKAKDWKEDSWSIIDNLKPKKKYLAHDSKPFDMNVVNTLQLTITLFGSKLERWSSCALSYFISTHGHAYKKISLSTFPSHCTNLSITSPPTDWGSVLGYILTTTCAYAKLLLDIASILYTWQVLHFLAISYQYKYMLVTHIGHANTLLFLPLH